MAFTGTNICGSKVTFDTYSGADKASLALDCVLVTALVSLVCIVVIGKIDLRLGEVGTLSNPWMQGMLGAGLGIFAVDVVTLVVKHYSSPEQRKQEPQAAVSEPAEAVATRPISYGQPYRVSEWFKTMLIKDAITSPGDHRRSFSLTRTDGECYGAIVIQFKIILDVNTNELSVRFANEALLGSYNGAIPPLGEKMKITNPQIIQRPHSEYANMIRLLTEDPPL